MKQAALLFALVACSPIDIGGSDGFDGLDGLDHLGRGAVKGAYGVAQFSFADGCPGKDVFGCPEQVPPLAVGAHLQLYVSAVDYDHENDRVWRATPRVAGSALTASRDEAGVIVVDAVSTGDGVLQLFDGDMLVDQLSINARRIAKLTANDETNIVLAGSRIGARVMATDSSDTVLYARGAVSATATGALAIDADQAGYFASSDQVVVSGTAPGAATVTFAAGDVMIDVPYTVVTRDDLTRVEAMLGFDNPRTPTNKLTLWAKAYVDDKAVRGGAACDWQIVNGGGRDAALASIARDDTKFGIQPSWTGTILYGSGSANVECRSSSRVAGPIAVNLAP